MLKTVQRIALISTIAAGQVALAFASHAFAAQPVPSEPTLTQGADGQPIATEEVRAVEGALESRVRDVLDGVIAPDKYAVYAQAVIAPDAKAIQSYYEERALTTLPGIPAPDPEVADPANNKLYSMVKSKKIIVVLDKSVSSDQELVAKEIVKAKISIDEKKGDVLDFRRTEVPTSGERSIASQGAGGAGTQDWVKWVLVALAIALALSVGVLLWQVSLLRERVDARAKLKADIKVDTTSDAAATVRKAATDAVEGGEEGSEAAEGGISGGKARKIRDADPVTVAELKEKILSIAVAQPKAASLVARKLMATREGMHKFAVACEAIGFEYAKQLFDSVSPARWRALGEYLRDNLTEITRAPVGEILMQIYTDMLADSIGNDPSRAIEGPFDFLHKLTDSELARLFENEDPAHIAFIAAFWEPEEMSQVLSILDDSKRKDAILQVARLQGLPREVVEQAAIGFAERLKSIRSRNEVEVNGSEVVAKMLGVVDTDTEEELLSFIAREDPAARDRLRAHFFSFDSIPLVPPEILQSLYENAEPDSITKALVGAPEEVVGAVLAVLPPKQRSIVEDDVRLANSQGTIPKHEAGAARKQMITEIRKALRDRGIELNQLGAAPAESGGGYGGGYSSPEPAQPAEAAVPVAEADTNVVEINPTDDSGSGQAA